MEEQILKIRSHGNDLFADLPCTCPQKTPKLAKCGCTHVIKLTGYADSNFFDAVNAEPRTLSCSGCARPFRIQWKRDGVRVRFLEPPIWVRATPPQ